MPTEEVPIVAPDPCQSPPAETSKGSNESVELDDDDCLEIVSDSGELSDKQAESDDNGTDNLIRIRSQDDAGIFAGEEENSDYEDFPMPEVELVTTPPPSRKRKQDFSSQPQTSFVAYDLSDDECFEFLGIGDEVSDTGKPPSPSNSSEESKKRDRMPLYLLKPDDYRHDPKKQAQIRRAIITYRHHQEKKEQIIKLTDENKKLREHIEELKLKLLETASCGCVKNKRVQLDLLDVHIPAVPPRMYLRGNRPVLAAPYHKFPSTSTQSLQTTIKDEWDFGYPSLPVANALKPITNPQVPISRVSNAVMAGKMANGGMPKLKLAPARVVTNVTPSRQQVVMSTIKTEPGLLAPTQPLMRSLQSTNQINVSPATSNTVSKIMFANKASSNSNAAQTASQLLFAANLAAKNQSQQPNNGAVTRAFPSGVLIAVSSSQSPDKTKISQMPSNVSSAAKMFSVPNVVPAARVTATPKVTAVQVNSTSQVFRSASGQLVRVVQGPAPSKSVANSVKVGSVPYFKPIAPKPVPAVSRENEKREFEENWRKFAEGIEENTMSAPGVTNGIGMRRSLRSRKQTLDSSNQAQKVRRVISAGGSEIELNKYADIVFEEAE